MGVFLLVAKELIKNTIFPTLTKKQSSKIILTVAFMAWTIALACIGAWIYVSIHLPNESTTDQKSNQTELLLDAVLLGQYHFAYESFLVMRLENKNMRGYEENTFSVFRSLAHKFKLPDFIINDVNNLSAINDTHSVIEKSGKITSFIYDYLSINSDPNYAYLYVLAKSKETYLKLLENRFPKTTLDIYELSARKQATNLGLPSKVVNNILSNELDYNDIIKLMK